MPARSAWRPSTRKGLWNAPSGGGGTTPKPYQALLDLNPSLITPSINDAVSEGLLYTTTQADVPATNVGDPVGLIKDFSGAGNDAFQSIPNSRPILGQTAGGNWYLAFDGIDDYYVVDGSFINVNQAVDLFVSVELTDAGAYPYLWGSNSDNGFEMLYFDLQHVERVVAVTSGGVLSVNAASPDALGVPVVRHGAYNPAAGVVDLHKNSSEVSVSSAPGVVNSPLVQDTNINIGRGLNDNIRCISGKVFGIAYYQGANILSAADRLVVEQYMADSSGVTLP